MFIEHTQLISDSPARLRTVETRGTNSFSVARRETEAARIRARNTEGLPRAERIEFVRVATVSEKANK